MNNFFKSQYVNLFKVETQTTFQLYTLNELIELFNIKSPINLLTNILKDSCKSDIGIEYIKQLSQNCVLNPNIYDIIIIANNIITTNEASKNKYDKIQGFIIVEKGECQTYLDNFCINLICSKSSVGGILIALYIYIIIQNDEITNKIGLLELANAYYNPGGLCLYSKYGFIFDKELSNETCFKYFPPNLPMKVNINTYGINKEAQKNTLLNILKNNSQNFTKPSICYKKEANKQKLLGLVLNLQLVNYMSPYITKKGEANDPYLDEYTYGIYKQPFVTSNNTEIDYYKLLQIINEKYTSIDNFINNIDNIITDEQSKNILNSVIKYPQQIISMFQPRMTRSKAPTSIGGKYTKKHKTRGKPQFKNKKYTKKLNTYS